MVEKTIGNKQGDSVTVNYTLADSCADTTVVGATSSVSWLTATASTPSNHAGTITITATESGTSYTRHAFVTPSINGEPCDNNRIKVTQSPGEPPEPGVLACYRGTDNGTDYFKDGTKQSHPILLCGDIGSNDGDSIYVEGGLEYSIDNKASWHQLTQGEGFKPASWVRVYLENNIGCCGNPYIGMETVEEFNASGTDLKEVLHSGLRRIYIQKMDLYQHVRQLYVLVLLEKNFVRSGNTKLNNVQRVTIGVVIIHTLKDQYLVIKNVPSQKLTVKEDVAVAAVTAM